MAELKTFNRLNKHSVKWDEKVFLDRFNYTGDKPYPLYVADMDFKMDEIIKEKMFEALEEADFGYPSDFIEFKESIKLWYSKHHHLELNSYIIPALSTVSSINILCSLFGKGGILINTPIYGQFKYSVSFGKEVTVPLILEKNRYYLDFLSIEEKLKEDVKVIILCNPHNPSGRNWTSMELKRLVDLAKKYDCYIFSDEIHSDIDLAGSFVSLANFFKDYEKLAIASSANKTFNISGLRTSFVLTPSKEIVEAFNDYLTTFHFEANRFGTLMTSICYNYGDKWLENLKETIRNNYLILLDLLKDLDLEIMKPDSGYLVWIKLNKVNDLEDFVRSLGSTTGVMVETGSRFIKDYEEFIRINLATSSKNIKEALNLFKEFYLNK